MKKLFTLLLLIALTPFLAHAQENLDGLEVQLPEGWSVPEKKDYNKLSEKDWKKGEGAFRRNPNAPQPDWRRPLAPTLPEDEKTLIGSALCFASYVDFANGKGKVLENVILRSKAKENKWVCGNDFTFKSSNKADNNYLKKEALVVIFKDSLYVNGRKLRVNDTRLSDGYVRGYRYQDAKICFVGFSHNSSAFVLPVLTPWAVGIASFYVCMHDKVCYILSSDNRKTNYLRTDNVEMLMLGQIDRDDLWSWYKSIPKNEYKMSAPVVLNIMEELNMLRPN